MQENVEKLIEVKIKEAFKLLGVPPERIEQLKRLRAQKNTENQKPPATLPARKRSKGRKRSRVPRNPFKLIRKSHGKGKGNKEVFVLRDALPDVDVLFERLKKKERD
jgi:hypothetical protein